ncbi:MAG TPA: hypothetical protein VH682_20190, partial [Gemmataceae bacterium]
GEQAHLQGQVTAQTGGSVTPPDLSQSGYRLAGGEMVVTSRGPACTLIYTNAQGGRITLFLPVEQKPGTGAPRLAEAGSGNRGSAPQLAEAGSGNGGMAPQFAEAGGGNGGRAPQFAEAGGDTASRAPRLAEAGGGNSGHAPQFAEAAGGNGGGTTGVATTSPCP